MMPYEFHTHVKSKITPDQFEDEDFVTKEYVDDKVEQIVVDGVCDGGADGAMPEPPDDDKLYGRTRAPGATGGSWEEVVGAEFPEPFDDGKLYGRTRGPGAPNGLWQEVVIEEVGPLAGDVTGPLDATVVRSLVGDVTGPLAATQVFALQGFPVSNITPTRGQVLTFNGALWLPWDVGAGELPQGAQWDGIGGAAWDSGSTLWDVV